MNISGLDKRDSISGWGTILFLLHNIQTSYGAQLPSKPMGNLSPFLGGIKRMGFKKTIHLHRMPKLTTHGAIPLLSIRLHVVVLN
jgi:hypothetical protein